MVYWSLGEAMGRVAILWAQIYDYSLAILSSPNYWTKRKEYETR